VLVGIHVSFVALRFALAATASLAAAQAIPEAARTPVVWQPMAPGASRATLIAGDGATKISLYRFSLKTYRAEVAVGAGTPAHAETASDFRRRRGAVAAVNGGFFDQRGAPLGLRIAAAKLRSPLLPHADWGVLLLYGDHARIIHTRELPPHEPAQGAIQVGPRLVVGGQPLQLKPQRARRTAVALDRGGEELTLVVVDAPVDANQLASRLAAAGFDTALMLDGGPSTQLGLEVGDVHLDLTGGYPVPDLLAIFKRPPGKAASRAPHP
jgi:uncharacterized protein YigE (DUF2233 family)